jgi:hypothetical protein
MSRTLWATVKRLHADRLRYGKAPPSWISGNL